VSVLIEGEEALAITPSSIDYFDLTENDICIVGFDSKPVEGEHRPSIETGFHIAVYKNRLDVNAVIHTHQTFASIFTVLNRPIPALFDEQVLHLGNIIDVIPYGVSGSPDPALTWCKTWSASWIMIVTAIYYRTMARFV